MSRRSLSITNAVVQPGRRVGPAGPLIRTVGERGPRPRLRLMDEFCLTVGSLDLSIDRQSRRVAACVAVTGRADRATIAARLWPDVDDGAAARALRTALYRLDVSGHPIIDRTGGWLRIADGVEVDLHDERRVCAKTQIDRDDLARIGSLRNDLLVRWDDEWLGLERHAHRELRFLAVERGAELLLMSDHPDRAIEAALRVVVADPFRERSHRVIIQAHKRMGNHLAARRQMQVLREALMSFESGDGAANLVAAR